MRVSAETEVAIITPINCRCTLPYCLLLSGQWLVSSITCLFQNKGSRAEAKNYRGIYIMATLLPQGLFLSTRSSQPNVRRDEEC